MIYKVLIIYSMIWSDKSCTWTDFWRFPILGESISVRKHHNDDFCKAVWNKYKLKNLSRDITELNQFMKNVPLGS